ncbi:30S ribosomal protein S4e, partial [Candidatus Woesearchaeota archaeon]|nr:30S ribosomal protein S4e [Candidatus Woesearchaeota archaeon]
TKIIGKKMQNKGLLQLNLSDGRNILTKEKNYSTGDTLLIETPSNKIQKHLQLEPGALVYLIDGKHVSDIGTIKTIEQKTITYTNTENKQVQTLKKYAYVVGKEKPLITLK